MTDTEKRCDGCYDSFFGPWCDNCDQWPCICDADGTHPSHDDDRAARDETLAQDAAERQADAEVST